MDTSWRSVHLCRIRGVSADTMDGQVEDLEKLAPQLLLDF